MFQLAAMCVVSERDVHPMDFCIFIYRFHAYPRKTWPNMHLPERAGKFLAHLPHGIDARPSARTQLTD